MTGMMVELAALLFGFGLVGLCLGWWVAGRDPAAGFAARRLSQPPDGLPPGVVGVLLDRGARPRHAVATLMHLGQRGVVALVPREEAAGLRRDLIGVLQAKLARDGGRVAGAAAVAGRPALRVVPRSDPRAVDFVRRDGAGGGHRLAAFERRLLDDVYTGSRWRMPREEARRRLRVVWQSGRPRADLERAAVEAGLFGVPPTETVRRWRGWGGLVTAVAVVGGAVGSAARVWPSGWVWLPILSVAAVGLLTALLAPRLVSRTARGADAAARWRAFRGYLADLGRRRDPASAAEVSRYLPYLVAFGLDAGWRGWFDQHARDGGSGLSSGDGSGWGEPSPQPAHAGGSYGVVNGHAGSWGWSDMSAGAAHGFDAWSDFAAGWLDAASDFSAGLGDSSGGGSDGGSSGDGGGGDSGGGGGDGGGE